jgi:GST-like protein
MQLYYFPTPNGRKVSIALEEMALAYEVIKIDILKGEQQQPAFLEISPNGRIPGLVDQTSAGERVVIFESGAILQYLGRKSGQFYPTHEAQRCWVDAWLFWQMAGLGPMTGQITWFVRASKAPGRNPDEYVYPIKRYKKEVQRLYGVLERQLDGKEYICDDYSIADMASWPWIEQHHDYIGLDDYPNIRAWRARVGARPAVQRAMKVCEVVR